MVKWGPILERHIKGECECGEVWIRLDRNNKVTGMYTLFGNTKKYMPEEEWMTEVDGAKLVLEEKVLLRTKAIKWSSELRSKPHLKNGYKNK